MFSRLNDKQTQKPSADEVWSGLCGTKVLAFTEDGDGPLLEMLLDHLLLVSGEHMSSSATNDDYSFSVVRHSRKGISMV